MKRPRIEAARRTFAGFEGAPGQALRQYFRGAASCETQSKNHARSRCAGTTAFSSEVGRGSPKRKRVKTKRLEECLFPIQSEGRLQIGQYLALILRPRAPTEAANEAVHHQRESQNNGRCGRRAGDDWDALCVGSHLPADAIGGLPTETSLSWKCRGHVLRPRNKKNLIRTPRRFAVPCARRCGTAGLFARFE